MIRFLICTSLFAATCSDIRPVAADTPPTFYQLATKYRASVEQFERLLKDIGSIDRNDERFVDRLEDATRKMKLAARNPRHANRLFHEWQDVQRLHREVEERIFGKYTPNHDIDKAWYAVTYYHALFAEEFMYDLENPRHDGTVRRKPTTNARRNSYLRSSLMPSERPTPSITLIPPR